MLDVFKKLFESDVFCGVKSESRRAKLEPAQVELACAALLIEVAVIDSHFDETELSAVRKVLESEFKIAASDIDSMISTARRESADSTSMYQFTRLVNDHLDFDDKFSLITNMWRIAYADGHLDKYEEYIIRKVSDLIYLNHSDFIRAKITARPV